MKYYLFIDNFRGFSDTCIPITDVNFLVGENSTGKTSVLSLLKMLSGPGFLFDLELSDEDVGFRHFSDMVSAHSKRRNYFRIGFVWEEPSRRRGGGGGARSITGCLLTYEEKDGLPRLSKFTFCREQETVTLLLRSPSYYYRVDKRSKHPTVQEVVSDLRLKWVQEHAKTNTKAYRKLVAPPDYSGRLPILFALSLISARTSRSKKKARSGDEEIEYPPYTAFPPELTWLAPIRTKSKRTYDEWTLDFSSEGAHTPYVISKMLHSKPARRFRDLVRRFGKQSSLFQNIRTKNFGTGATAPFELDVVLDGKALNIINVGYGVSQSLPVLVEAFASAHGTWFAIQQPEVHLHPRAQATLGDVFFDMALNDHKLFLVETHSDFTIDRFRMNYRRELKRKPNSQVLFFERRDKRNVITPLAIGNMGELPADQPESYRQFFIREQMSLLGI